MLFRFQLHLGFCVVYLACMNIVFMGTPEFAVPSLEAIHRSKHALRGLVTQPDRQAGRGRKMSMPATKKWAKGKGIPILQPTDLRDSGFLEGLAAFAPDILAVVAYRLLPPGVLSIPSWGAVNVHASLLPKYRGAAPIQWAIANGEKQTGVTVFKIDRTMDTGSILLQRSVAIDENERADSLHDRLKTLGAEALVNVLDGIEAGESVLLAQDESRATLAPKLKRKDGRIDWTRSAVEIHNRVRGFHPFPGAFTLLPDGSRLCVSKTLCMPDREAGESPGTYLADPAGMLVATGNGCIRLVEVKPECRMEMDALEFLRGCGCLSPGQVLR